MYKNIPKSVCIFYLFTTFVHEMYEKCRVESKCVRRYI